MRTVLVATLLVTVTACAADPTSSDPAAEDGAFEGDEVTAVDGKADGFRLDGYYVVRGDDHDDGDILNLAFYPAEDRDFARTRCYGAGCAKQVLASDKLEQFRSRSGKRYIQFQAFEWTDRENFELKHVVVDTYEIKRSRTSLQLRKTYGSRWFTLDAIGEQALCAKVGGTWNEAETYDGVPVGAETHCNCGGTAITYFVPGSGVCGEPVDTGESECDDTGGHYVDDDWTALGTYCLCPLGQELTTAGCADI